MHTNEKIYFPGLHGLRFLAASTVIISHVEEMKDVFGLRSGNEGPLRTYTLVGDLAVTFFFVLSGFLITFLLLSEQQQTGGISLRKFYARRIFRIFPLYYLTVLLGLFVLPHFAALYFPEWSEHHYDHFPIKTGLYLTLFSNLAVVTTYPVAYVSHTWSIGVEEQFYLLWPLLFLFFRRIGFGILLFFMGYFLLAKSMMHLGEIQGETQRIFRVAGRFFDLTRFHIMALGGLVAFGLFKNRVDVKFLIFSRLSQGLVILFTLGMGILGVEFGYFTHEVYAFLFAYILLGTACSPNPLFHLESSFFRQMGNISYGIYMYHFVCVRLAIAIQQILFPKTTIYGVFENIMVYGLSFMFSIALAMLSYRYFESFFLRLKKRFTIVPSGI